MANAPLLSVITVTRNLIEAGRRELFREAMDCVQAQSYGQVEHVIFDGLSDDGTVAMIDEARNRLSGAGHPIVFETAQDAGLYDAMNKAVALASGEYVLFLNSDDSLASETVLADLVAALGQDRPGFAFGGTLQTLADGSTREFARTNLKSFLQRMPFCHNSMLVRKQVFESLGGHDLSFRVASDYDFVFRMLQSGVTGRDARLPASKYADRGVSGDVLAVARDYARVWSRYFGALTGQGEIDPETCLDWYRTGQLPVSMCYAAYRSAGNNDLVRQAALHSLKITLRRKLQPWRHWDNLKG
ncbi:glycosyltransferase [Sedimentitalea todarodis]|uniref:Glycosyltransferase n=1 Tax=Sedimentitalea todarodis TaxID=1631240 RepID=A0ABU3VJC9_9RHOB|nr:glycosyltransferase [Sedimentitalea todarodis]MDU9006292.1 glycosyltransferase [Sedimentitalea todarodis]